MIDYAYYNGVFTPYDAASIPITDRSIFFSDAVYEVIVGKGKKAYQLERHLKRLYTNAERIGLTNLPLEGELYDVINDLTDVSEADDFALYIQLSAYGKRRSHARCDYNLNVLMTITECTMPEAPDEIKAITLPDMRHAYCDVKTVSLLPAVLSVEEAQRRGADIAIFERGGHVTECSYANISLLKDGALITHPLDSEILPGITQENLIEVSKGLGMAHLCRSFTVDEMLSADAVLISSTTKLIKICTEIDGRTLNVLAQESASKLFEQLKHDLYDET